MPFISNKREFLARRLHDVGLVTLIERLARRPGLLVLVYHRIGDPASSPYYAPVASATAAALEEELRSLVRTHRVIGIDEAVALADAGFRVDEPTALVTFDDGYRDNFEVALPVLTRVGVTATFFLVSAFLECPQLTWWDHIAYVVNSSDRPSLHLSWPEPLALDLSVSRTAAIARLVQAYLDHDIAGADERRFRAELEDQAGVHVDEAALGALFMTWDEARALVAAGMSVGSHSRSHARLARLPEDEQRAELVESRRMLEGMLKVPIQGLAYPYGWPGTYDALTSRLAGEAGYRVAFTAAEGVNRCGATDPFAVRRISVGFADSPVLQRTRWAFTEAFGRSPV